MSDVLDAQKFVDINLVCRKLVKKYRKFSATKNVIPSESAVLMALDPNVLEHEQKKGMAV